MDLVLQTNTDNPSLALLGAKRFSDGSGYAAVLYVSSGAYSVKYHLFFEEHPLKEFIASLSEMQRTLSGVARLKPMWEPQFIEFKATSLGHLLVRGSLPEHSQYQQSLVFEFPTDQTCLAPFISALKSLQSSG